MRMLGMLCLLACLLPSFHAVALVQEAAANNTALSQLLLGAENACHSQAKPITEGSVCQVAEIRAVAMVPEVGGITSDRASPRLLWSWSASCQKEARFALASDAGCPEGELEYYNPSKVELENGMLHYRYGSSEKEIQLSAGGPNPVALELDSSLLGETDLQGVYANLSVRLEASLLVRYSYKRTEYVKHCNMIGNYLACGCMEETAFGMKTFENAVSDSRKFLVETGPDYDSWLNPPLQKRLDGGERGKLLFFAKRMPSNISIYSGHELIGYAEPYAYSAKKGECGEVRVEREFSPHGQNTFLNMSQEAVAPFQLVGQNFSCLPFYLEFAWNATPGNQTIAISYEDAFSSQENFTREFSVRDPAAFFPEGNPEGGGLMETRDGNDSLAPAAYPSETKDGHVPDYAVLAALLALPFALLAGALMKKSI